MRRNAVAVLVLALAASCSESRPYPDRPEKNLQVRTVTAGGHVALDIHSLDGSCTASYEGSVALERPLVEVGLPPGRPSLLVFEFSSSSRFSGGSSIKKEVQVLPRPGYRYEVRVSYKESLYSVELTEIDVRTGAERELEMRRGC